MEKNKKTYSRESCKKLKSDSFTYVDVIEDNEIQEVDDIEEIDEIVDISAENRRLQEAPTVTSSEPVLSKPDVIIDHPHVLVDLDVGSSDQEQQSPKKPDIDSKTCLLLEPGHMLNDTIVELYMNSLLNEIPSRKENFHLFSTFFYSRIKKLHMKSHNIDPTNEFKQSVRRWHKHIKLMDKDYLIIPICDSAHWLLVIACFVNKMPAQSDTTVVKDKAKSCLLIFDSLGFKYMDKFTAPIRSFLTARWQYEKPGEVRNFGTLQFKAHNAIVPKQKNLYDCGVYLLHFFEKFISQPFYYYEKVVEYKDLTADWAIDTRWKRQRIKNRLCPPSHSANNSKK